MLISEPYFIQFLLVCSSFPLPYIILVSFRHCCALILLHVTGISTLICGLAYRNRHPNRQRQRGILHQWYDLRKQEVLRHQGQPSNRWGLDNGHQDEESRRRANI